MSEVHPRPSDEEPTEVNIHPSPASPDPTQREGSHAQPAQTLREGGVAPTLREGAGPSSWRLPRAIAHRFALVRELDARGSEADAFLVRDQAGTIVFAKVYRKGIQPNSEILRKLTTAAPEHVVRLIEAGFAGEERCFFELLEYASEGTLADLVRSRGGRLETSAVRAVLTELNDAMRHVHELDIEHRDLKPENILVRSVEPLDLVLTDFGIASAMTTTQRFTTTNRTVRYSPPEALSGAVHRTKWDYWSLGMILVELLTGQSPFADQGEQAVTLRLISHPTDELVEGITDPAWRMLCRGLLRRDPKVRWDGSIVQRWLANPGDRGLTVAEESGTAATGGAPPYRFLGKALHTPSELAEALAASWNEGDKLWKTERPAILRWLRHDLGETRLADALESIANRGDAKTAPDAQMFAVIHLLSPSRTPSFRGSQLTCAEIRAASEKAVNGSGMEAQWLLAVHQNDILTLAGRLQNAEPGLADVQRTWNAGLAEHGRLARETHEKSGGTVAARALTETDIAMLLAASTPGSRALAPLQRQAVGAASSVARRRLWFKALGAASSASAAGAMLLIQLAPAAEAEVAEGRRGRAERNNTLWWHLLAGAFAGLTPGLLIWAGILAACDRTDSTCLAYAWPMRALDGGDLLYAGLLVVAIIVLLVRVHLLTTTKEPGRG